MTFLTLLWVRGGFRRANDVERFRGTGTNSLIDLIDHVELAGPSVKISIRIIISYNHHAMRILCGLQYTVRIAVFHPLGVGIHRILLKSGTFPAWPPAESESVSVDYRWLLSGRCL